MKNILFLWDKDLKSDKLYFTFSLVVQVLPHDFHSLGEVVGWC